MIIAGENILLHSVDPICWLSSQSLVVFLRRGDEVLKFFNLPRLLHWHVDGAGQGGWAGGHWLKVESRKSW